MSPQAIAYHYNHSLPKEGIIKDCEGFRTECLLYFSALDEYFVKVRISCLINNL